MTTSKDKKLYAPKWINERAREIFRDLMTAMGDDAKESDLSLYCDFAMVQSNIETLAKAVDSEGFTVLGQGGEKINPKASLLNSYFAQSAQLRRDLNLTPKARAEKKVVRKASPLDRLRKR